VRDVPILCLEWVPPEVDRLVVDAVVWDREVDGGGGEPLVPL